MSDLTDQVDPEALGSRAARGAHPPAIGAALVALAMGGVLAWLVIAGDPSPAPAEHRLRVAVADAPNDTGPEATGTADEDSGAEAPQDAGGGTTAEGGATDADDGAPEPISLAAVDPALMQQTSRGPLPTVSPDGRKPWQVYARPPGEIGEMPRLAIVVVGLGLAESTHQRALALPGSVSLSFSPYATDLEAASEAARAAGHEVLLDLPMEPDSYPTDDPGPHTLLTTLTPAANIERLEWLMGRFAGYVGVVTQMGSKFTVSPEALGPVLAALQERGLMLVDSRVVRRSIAATLAGEIDLPHAINDRFADEEPSRAAIDRAFEDLVKIARQRGTAVAIVRPLPISLDRVAAWATDLASRGIALVPVSAVVEQLPDE